MNTVPPPPPETRLHYAQPQLERLLTENLLPFWYPGSLDGRAGYRLNHDCSGHFRGNAPKGCIAQTRTLWFFSRLARSPYGSPLYRAAARRGFDFLRRRLWDRRHGGVFWGVSPRGHFPRARHKYAVAHSFALYGCAEYAQGSGDPGATEMARQLFEQFENHFRDSTHLGYFECFRRNWRTPRQHTGRLGAPTNLKNTNTHIHVLEALTSYFAISKDERARLRCMELIALLSDRCVREGHSCRELHHRDWTPWDPSNLQTYYGHDLECVWLCLHAATVCQIELGDREARLLAIADHAFEHGIDPEGGGLFECGPAQHPASGRARIWWAQAEALLAAFFLFERTGQERYATYFEGLLRWIYERQADWEHGEWYARVEPDGTRHGDKAAAWKTPYHNGRALLLALDRLRTPVSSAAD